MNSSSIVLKPGLLSSDTAAPVKALALGPASAFGSAIATLVSAAASMNAPLWQAQYDENLAALNIAAARLLLLG
jgi:hypothetical protein